jgi:3-oxoacyl-[acyl-carrier-protein] synthase III
MQDAILASVTTPVFNIKAGVSLLPPQQKKRWKLVIIMFIKEGQQVSKWADNQYGRGFGRIMERNGLSSEDVQWLVPHQANKRIIDATTRRWV